MSDPNGRAPERRPIPSIPIVPAHQTPALPPQRPGPAGRALYSAVMRSHDRVATRHIQPTGQERRTTKGGQNP